MATKTVDDALKSYVTFIGYQGNRPTNETEYNNLTPINLPAESKLPQNKVWNTDSPPSWTDLQNKVTELQNAEDTKCNTKVSAYRKLSMTDDEIKLIAPDLESYL